MKVFLAMAVVLVAGLASAPPVGAQTDPVVIQFRSQDDPSVTPDPTVCAEAPFVANVVAGASLWSVRTRGSDGVVVEDFRREIGTGTACLRVTDLTFPPFASAPLYGEITLGDLVMRVGGVCTVTSNDVPLAGIILAGCAMDVVAPPTGFVGGTASSNSVFNPFRIPGFGTGSYWTVRLYPE